MSDGPWLRVLPVENHGLRAQLARHHDWAFVVLDLIAVVLSAALGWNDLALMLLVIFGWHLRSATLDR